MSDWQPIETVPKKTPVLIYDGNIICVAEFGPIFGPDDDRLRWQAIGATGWEWENDFEFPTHWMPLPKAP